MPEIDHRTRMYYDRNSHEVAKRYESAPSSTLFPHIFTAGETILDIGCGTARDLAHLYARGTRVTGIEPSEALLAEARSRHPEIAHRLHHGTLPQDIPQEVRRENPDGFDVVLLSAVLMHIPDSALFESAVALRGLMKSGGQLVVSVPLERDDVDPTTNRSPDGRLMVIRPVSRIRLLFERLGLELTNRWESADRLGRPGIRWVTLQFAAGRDGVSRSVELIERVINRDSKTATYKLALLRSCCDIAERESGRVNWTPDGRVAIHADAVAEKWIEYYWPLLTTDRFLAQTQGETPDFAKPVAFRKALTEFVSLFDGSGGLAAYMDERSSGGLTKPAEKYHRSLVAKIRDTIVRGPVYYAGGGSSDNKPFAYHKDARAILISADLWREFSLLAHWIRDSLLIRWAEETQRMSGGAWQAAEVLGLLIKRYDPERHVTEARNVYLNLDAPECVWSGRVIRKPTNLHVDHAIPYALWKDNSLWNLLPASRQVNLSKGEKLPTLDLLQTRKDPIVDYWRLLHDAHSHRFIHEAANLAGPLEPGNWENPLFAVFTEAVETTAVRRGAERWGGV